MMVTLKVCEVPSFSLQDFEMFGYSPLEHFKMTKDYSPENV